MLLWPGKPDPTSGNRLNLVRTRFIRILGVSGGNGWCCCFPWYKCGSEVGSDWFEIYFPFCRCLWTFSCVCLCCGKSFNGYFGSVGLLLNIYWYVLNSVRCETRFAWTESSFIGSLVRIGYYSRIDFLNSPWDNTGSCEV